MSLGYPNLSGPGALLMFAFASIAGAESAGVKPTAPARAVLWYRSSEGCPDGVSFLASVGDRASLVRLAEAGDRVDFVVNLALTEDGARGRLERETERGTVAIREVDDESCDRVAQVVALNLSLALDPAALERPVTDESPEPASTEVATSADSASADPATATDLSESQGGEKEKARASESSDRQEQESHDLASPDRSVRFRVGIQAGGQSGVATRLMTRAALFVEAQQLISWAPDLTLRAFALGARGSSETSIGAIEQAFWAGRVELCPLSFGAEVVSVSPCAAGEIGQIWASGASRDRALWGAVGAHARAEWVFSSRFALEADVGADIPLRTYEVAAGSIVLYSSAPVGISAVLGASFAF